MKKKILFTLITCALIYPSTFSLAAEKKPSAKDPNNIAPTHKDVKYGAHKKELINFWQVDADEATRRIARHPRGRLDGWQKSRDSAPAPA